MLTELRHLRDHLAWADAALLEALSGATPLPAEAAREFAHVLGSEEAWLARMEHRAPRTPIWPDLSMSELQQLAQATDFAHIVVNSGLCRFQFHL
jgi:hypothetical protein